MERILGLYAVNIIKTTSAPERIAKTRQLVQTMRKILLKNGAVTTDSCVALISNLVRATFDCEHTTSDQRAFLLSTQVVALIHDLIKANRGAGVILQGLIKGVGEKGVGFKGIGFYGSELLCTWFVVQGYAPNTEHEFLLSVFMFMYKCEDRQFEVCGSRSYNKQLTNDHLLPLVRAVLATKTQASINASAGSDMYTVLHQAAGIFKFSSVTRELLKHPLIDVNVRDCSGRTPLRLLVWPGNILTKHHFPAFTALLSHPDIDTTIPGISGKTPVDCLCSHLMNPGTDTNIALQMLQQICQHKTANTEMLQTTLTNITSLKMEDSIREEYLRILSVLLNHEKLRIETCEKIPCPQDLTGFSTYFSGVEKNKLIPVINKLDITATSQENLRLLFVQVIKKRDVSQLTRIILRILQRADFPVNCGIDDGMTTGHLVASTGSSNLMNELLKREELDATIPDNLGNTMLFYMCEHYHLNSVISYITKTEISWGFSVKNKLGQTVYDYYRDVEGRNPYLLKMLQNICGQQNHGQVAAPRAITVVPLPERQIRWYTVIPPVGTAIKVCPSTSGFYRSKLNKIRDRKVYDLTKSTKGKACILSVPEFKVRGLGPLPGYNADRENLIQLWTEMGFVVYVTRYDGQYHLTAKELYQAVKEFATNLTAPDQCAVLCILSHGGDGFIYGSDGGKVEIKTLLSNMDNINCVAMKGKPKILILQTCKGNMFDVGTTASHAGNDGLDAVAAADQPILPIISDLIQCSPCMQGYTSFVWTDPIKGSVFINAVVEIFTKYAGEEDIHSLLTWVNEEVGSELIPVKVAGSNHTVDHKQMSNFTSCLTKLLYFFPCPGGRNGQDW